ncbi:PadR family transcriptional regulator [Streptomyces sp. NPDC005438]|uniref:PadR family transcriptional regulator n=1 Tax=Streptomyces sp. NPDC005438 TaxID=3156880 RepID=UPI0033A495C9
MVAGKASNEHANRGVSQLRKGVLEYCVLALLRDQPRYGVELLEVLADSPVMATSQGTLYPLLSRLRRSGLADTFLVESASGPSRRYYELTDQGRQALEGFAGNWPGFRDAVDRFLVPGDEA